MHAVANYLKEVTPNTNVLYSTCENFTNELIDSIRLRSTSRNREADFRRKYRNVDVLLVDDIITTGASCREAARILKQAGAMKVYVFSLAHHT